LFNITLYLSEIELNSCGYSIKRLFRSKFIFVLRLSNRYFSDLQIPADGNISSTSYYNVARNGSTDDDAAVFLAIRPFLSLRHDSPLPLGLLTKSGCLSGA
jgi:hypothetical protein